MNLRQHLCMVALLTVAAAPAIATQLVTIDSNTIGLQVSAYAFGPNSSDQDMDSTGMTVEAYAHVAGENEFYQPPPMPGPNPEDPLYWPPPESVTYNAEARAFTSILAHPVHPGVYSMKLAGASTVTNNSPTAPVSAYTQLHISMSGTFTFPITEDYPEDSTAEVLVGGFGSQFGWTMSFRDHTTQAMLGDTLDPAQPTQFLTLQAGQRVDFNFTLNNNNLYAGQWQDGYWDEGHQGEPEHWHEGRWSSFDYMTIRLPEPVTLTALALGFLAVPRRRKRR